MLVTKRARSIRPSSAAWARNGKSSCGIVSPPCVDRERDPRPEDVRVEVDVERRARRRQADERRPARVGAHPDRLRERRRRTDRGEREVDAAPAGQLAHRLDRIDRGRVHDVGRPERVGVPELLRRDVDGDDLSRSAQQRALDDGEPDAAAADHGDRRLPPAPASPRARRPRRSRTRTRGAHACSIGSSSGTFTAHASCDDRVVGERPAAQHRRQQRAVARRGAAAASRGAARSSGAGRRAVHCGHSPHGAATRRRRGRRARRRSPRSPPPRRRRRLRGRAGSGTACRQPLVSTIWRSEWQSPQARTRTSTSRCPGESTVSSSTAGAASGSGVDDAAGHVARRSWSSRGTSGSLNVSTALGSVTTLSPSSSIVSWSRRHRRAGQPLGQRRLQAHRAERDVYRRPPHAEHSLQPLPELVPAHRVGAAELERAVRGGRLVDARARSTARDPRPRSAAAVGARTDDRRHGREAREPDERRQDAAVAAEDEARPEDHVLEARTP